MNKIIGNIKVVLDKHGPLTLRPSNHVATGGEGSVYVIGDTAIKIYMDRQKILWNDVSRKVQFFSANPHDFVVAPKGLVTTPSGEPIGYYMPFMNCEPMARIFTNDFRKRENFTDNDASVLIDRMREIVQFAHKRNAIIVDGNELNYLVMHKCANGPEPRLIDVDCWVIDDHWPPKVPIMLSIRDWHTKGWNEGSDWFAWSIVSFQVYTGIHPYKGHLNGFKPSELEKRMKANASVFAQGIRLNRAVRDFSVVPGPLLDWYFATFQHGKRTIPPSPFETGIATAQIARTMRAVITATGMLVFNKLYGKTNDPAIRIFPCGIALLDSGKLIDLSTKRQVGTTRSRDCEVVKVQNGWLKASFNGKNIRFSFIDEVGLNEKILALNLKGHKLVRYENRLFIVTNKGLTEVVLKVLGKKPILSVSQTWGVMINATCWFDGVGIQDTMGAMYVIAPFGNNACAQIRVRELDGLQPIMAKAGNRFITVIGMDQNGNYRKVELTFDKEYRTYKVWQGGTDNPDLNIAILPKGVCATIVNDGNLDIFVPASGTLNKVHDKQITTGMTLFNWENKVLYIQNGDVWSVRMK